MGSAASIHRQYDGGVFKPGAPRQSNDLPIYFIDFEKFEEHGEIPLFKPGENKIGTPIEEIDRENSFIVFISHCWLRNIIEAEGWRGKPMPDSTDNLHYNLCVEGIQRIRKELAPGKQSSVCSSDLQMTLCSSHVSPAGMEKCYVWIDYGCIDQDDDLLKEFHELTRVMEFCDCIFTPIIKSADVREMSTSSLSSLLSVKVKSLLSYYLGDYQPWLGNPHAVYLDRGWCRMEMLIASCLPLLSCGPLVPTHQNRRRCVRL